uniref:Uncharacterized protein n=1 Tax=Megaselia scalaris TaxID=36166 RepID=T1H0M3_MEGSC
MKERSRRGTNFLRILLITTRYDAISFLVLEKAACDIGLQANEERSNTYFLMEKKQAIEDWVKV